MKPTLKKTGYYYVSLSKNNTKPKFDVHRLVAITFLENINNYNCINHIDGDKCNNNVSNLEWCSYSYNAKHALEIGLNETMKGERNGASKLIDSDVVEIMNKVNGKTSFKDPKEILYQIAQYLNIIKSIIVVSAYCCCTYSSIFG